MLVLDLRWRSRWPPSWFRPRRGMNAVSSWMGSLLVVVVVVVVVGGVTTPIFGTHPLCPASSCHPNGSFHAAICREKFTLFKRKQHCLGCGNVVCDSCSPHRQILPNISKTQKQRVCNDCVNGKPSRAPSTDAESEGVVGQGARSSSMLAGMVARAGSSAMGVVKGGSTSSGNSGRGPSEYDDSSSESRPTSSVPQPPQAPEPVPEPPVDDLIEKPVEPQQQQLPPQAPGNNPWDALNSFYGPNSQHALPPQPPQR